MSAEIDRDIAEPEELDGEDADTVEGPDNTDLTRGQTPAQSVADDETRAAEEEGGENPGT